MFDRNGLFPETDEGKQAAIVEAAKHPGREWYEFVDFWADPDTVPTQQPATADVAAIDVVADAVATIERLGHTPSA